MRRAYREFIVMMWPWGVYVLTVFAMGFGVVAWLIHSIPTDAHRMAD